MSDYNLTAERSIESHPVPWTTVDEHISLAVEAFALTKRTQTDAERLAAAYRTDGRAPSVMAAAALYAACQLNDVALTQAEVAEELGTSVPSIRTHYQQMLAEVGVDV